jgi:hypothetical protein
MSGFYQKRTGKRTTNTTGYLSFFFFMPCHHTSNPVMEHSTRPQHAPTSTPQWIGIRQRESSWHRVLTEDENKRIPYTDLSMETFTSFRLVTLIVLAGLNSVLSPRPRSTKAPVSASKFSYCYRKPTVSSRLVSTNARLRQPSSGVPGKSTRDQAPYLFWAPENVKWKNGKQTV